ncbi:oxidoreductase, FAD/FMN-binding family protein [Tritrichomonas foetus]|uniref:Oxidoreductase, FAD/FMN-binding family protein n=1 Tax=Tritrichomonas foetus TaxID=1144522 RepID=A0A1J4KL52_9EUKA|nr:oxidoreductase, FAD/FMN-binding family protein [Tritrichomonas foetus]|eukprot:OHT11955.1 oxidoreductase, FAD/FMN-binding family protein [Tritrichomonas foetus]
MLREKSVLFTPIQIGNALLSNRFMRSATWEGKSDENGFPKESLLKMMKNLALGDCGLIVPGFAYPMKKCQVASNQTGMFTPGHAKAWKSTIDEIHNETTSKIIFQICHGGSKSSPELSGSVPEAPTAMSSDVHEMTNSDIEATIQSFIDAAVNLKANGADGIQIHCAHGYLLSAFLSPALNRRHDGWGGSPENRVKIVKEIASEIRKSCGQEFLISAKINGDDYDDSIGVTPVLCGWYISQLNDIDMFEISAGVGSRMYGTRINFDTNLYMRMIKPKSDAIEAVKVAEEASKDVPYFEGYNIDATNTIRRIAPNAKLAIVGGLRNFDTMDHVVAGGTADMISMARPFIRQPSLVKDLKKGTDDSKCISCALCSYGNKGVTCYYP